ncbi:MAG: carbamoyl phosphate synthase large subunit, partial [Thermoleophilia bacterium]
GAGQALPHSGNVFISARDADKPQAVAVAGALSRAGLGLIATSGTARALSAAGLPVREVRKISEGSPNVGELIRAGEVDLVINTPRGGSGARTDGFEIRAAAIRANIPYITTIEAARAAALAIADGGGAHPRALQDLVPSGGAPAGV